MTNVKLSFSRLVFVLCILLLWISLDLSYYFVISPIYAYSGYTFNPDIHKLIESLFITLFIAFILPWKIRKPSDFMVNILFTMPVLPTLSLYWLRGENRLYTYMLIISFIVIRVVAKTTPVIKLSRIKRGIKLGWVISLIFTIIILGYLIYRGGLRYFNLNLLKVYDFRREVGAVINVGIFGYLNSWVFKLFNPVLISWSLYKRQYALFVLFTCLQVVFFGISSHKSVLFSPLLIIALFVLLQKYRTMNVFFLTLFGAIGFTVILAIVFEQVVPASMLIRRVFFVPARLNYAYYDFFSQKGFVYMSNSVLSSFINYPFAYPPAQMISVYLQGHPYTWMNNGFLATSYMHFGFCGMIVYSFIVGLLLGIVDSLSKNRLPLWFSTSLVIVPFFSLFTSADLTTALLTHSLGPSLIILWLFSSRSTLVEGRGKKCSIKLKSAT